jgi:hypothetical protein
MNDDTIRVKNALALKLALENAYHAQPDVTEIYDLVNCAFDALIAATPQEQPPEISPCDDCGYCNNPTSPEAHNHGPCFNCYCPSHKAHYIAPESEAKP